MLFRRSHQIEWGLSDVTQRDDIAVSIASVRCRDLGLDINVEFRLHGGVTDHIDHSLTPFLPLASLSAWLLRRPVVMIDEVDSRALIGASTAASLLAGSPRTIKGRAGRMPSPSLPNRGTGIWFSRGVDSLSALFENAQAVTHLLGLEFVDPPYASVGQRALWSETVRAAHETDKVLLHLSTNARLFVDQLAGWDYTHSAVFSGLGLFLSPILERSWLAGGHREDTSQFQPSNRNDVQTAWSSHRVEVGQPPGETRRSEKARIVAQSELAQRFLRVCWESDGELNCGTCLKCLMTMTNFLASQSLDNVAQRFAAPFSLHSVRDLNLADKGTGSILLLDDLIDELEPGELREAWRSARTTFPLASHDIRTVEYL